MNERMNVEARRVALGLSRAELAKRAGLKHGATVWKVERAPDQAISDVTLSRINLALDAAEGGLHGSPTDRIAELEARLQRIETLVADVLSRLVLDQRDAGSPATTTPDRPGAAPKRSAARRR